MQKANAPTPFVLPFAANAASGYRNTIPVASQAGITPGAASYNDGFPPDTMTATGSGGIPPFGQDANGILYAATLAQQWKQSGFIYPYNSTFATNSNVNGYPAGAVLLGSNGYNLWLNIGDNNQTNPDTSGGTGWVPAFSNAGIVTINSVGGSVTLTQNQLNAFVINVTGALTSNLVVTMPLLTGSRYLVKNSTTGAYTVTFQGATGSGVSVSASVPQTIFSDGTNFYGEGLTGGPYLPLTGTAAAATQLSSSQNFSIAGAITAPAVSFNGTSAVVLNATLANGAVGLANMANLQANSLLGNPTASSATPVAITLTNGVQFVSGALGLGAITPSSINTAGSLTVGAGAKIVGNIAPSNGQGAYVGWNYTGGNGEMDFICNLGSGGGGFNWYSSNSSGSTVTQVATLTAAGALTIIAGLTATSGTFNGTITNNGYATLGATGAGSAANFIGTVGSVPGMRVAYNYTAGGGEVDLLNQWSGTGGFNFYSVSSSSPSLLMSLSGVGALSVTNTVTASGYNTSSDENLKKGIRRDVVPRDLTSASLTSWESLRGIPVAGRGIIAQDLRKVAPEYISISSDGSLAVDYSRAALEQAWFVTQQMQQLNFRIAVLEGRA